MLQILPIFLVQVKASNASENVLKGIRQVVYSLYRAKEIIKKVYNNKKMSYKNNKFKISATTLNEELELPYGLYSISDIQDYFEYILKNMEKRLIILH